MTDSDSLAARVQPPLATLLESGALAVVDEDHDPATGEAHVTLAGGDVRLRFVREGGMTNLDFAPADAPPSWWYDAPLIATHLGLPTDAVTGNPLDSPARTDALAGFVVAHLAAIRDAFSPARAEATLAALDDRRRDQLTAWWEDVESRGV